jgi:peptidylprolyl isomerase
MRLFWSCAAFAALSFAVVGCNNEASGRSVADAMKDLKIETLEEGEGDKVLELGDQAFFEYRGTLVDGTQFDSNMPEDKPDDLPFMVFLGATPLVKGWTEGVVGMKTGEFRRITVPPELGYGNTDNGLIPAGSTLIFDVRLLGMTKDGEEQTYEYEDLVVGTGAEAAVGDTVEVHYSARYINGLIFDDSRDRGETVKFVVGSRNISAQEMAIDGIDHGVRDMKVGGTRILTLPQGLVYHNMGSEEIQGSHMIEVELELVGVTKG